jgi:hypothetical protein
LQYVVLFSLKNKAPVTFHKGFTKISREYSLAIRGLINEHCKDTAFYLTPNFLTYFFSNKKPASLES